MEAVKKHVTSAQVTAMVEFMQEHSDVATGFVSSGLEKKGLEAQWHELTDTLNSMGGAVKSIDQWKKTWSYLKWSNKKKGPHKSLKHPRSSCDSIGMSSSNKNVDTTQDADNDDSPPKKRFASFDEEIVSIERDKLELEREYKIQKIEALSRIAAALEELANKS